MKIRKIICYVTAQRREVAEDNKGIEERKEVGLV